MFPDVALKVDVWTRATDTRVLPDRWIALGYRGGQEVARAVSGAILEPLVLSLGPRPGEDAEVDISGDGLQIDAALAWTMDFAEAEKAGMGFRLPLNADTAAAGFDELIVLGVKGSLAPDDVARAARRAARRPPLRARAVLREAGDADQQHVRRAVRLSA